jgi:4-aminobutyrate aminotransferase
MDWPSGSHASTFGGNPVACAAALASLRLIEKRYRANAVTRGRELRMGLEELAQRYALIREVRGLGLMIGAEVQDHAGHPASSLRDRIIDHAFRGGLLLLPCGASTIRFCPPLCLYRRQVAIGLQLLELAIRAAIAETEPRTLPATEMPGVAPALA